MPALDHRPGVLRLELNAQVHRMLHLDPPLLVPHGVGEHGVLYMLASFYSQAQDAKGAPAP